MTEDRLQQWWAANPLAGRTLRCRSGKEVRILDAGELNTTDGPDFLNAHVMIGGIHCYGAVELHLHSSGWFDHHHHLNQAYDKVILHVVSSAGRSAALRTDGTQIPELDLQTIPVIWQSKVEPDLRSGFSCPVAPAFISAEAARSQLEKARTEYFNHKADDFFSFYDPHSGLQEAWKKALIISLFDGMGIPHNRSEYIKAARRVCEVLFTIGAAYTESEKESLLAELTAYHWKYKSVFHATHPRKILPKLLNVVLLIRDHPFGDIIRSSDTAIWDQWMKMAGLDGYFKPRVLKATVFLPALYAAAVITSNSKLSEMAISEWKKSRVLLPESIRRELRFLPENVFEYASWQLSSVHQVREWCRQRRCADCEVLKRAIAS